MKKINLIIILFIIIFQSCNKEDDCGACFTPPQIFTFEIVDKTSRENLFTNGTYESGNIEITNNFNNNQPIGFTFISENNINLIQISSIGWKTEIVNLKIDISGNHIFNFHVDTERKTDECCSYNSYNEIRIEESDYELDTQSGTYKILVD